MVIDAETDYCCAEGATDGEGESKIPPQAGPRAGARFWVMFVTDLQVKPARRLSLVDDDKIH